MSSIELATYPGLDDRVVILRAGDTVDAAFIRTKRFNVLVDTLDTPDACRTALDLLGGKVWDRPLIVVNSHMDWDHFWGNSAVAGKSIIVAHDRALHRFHSPAVQETLLRKAQEDDRFSGIELHAPTLTFSEQLRLEGGDLTLELFPTPGHTPDHIAVWIPELRVCLAVDAVETPIPEAWSDDPEDLRALMTSLRLIRQFEAEHVILAHGQTSSPDIVSQNLAYFETLAERVKQIDDGWEPGNGLNVPDSLNLWNMVTPLKGLSPDETRFYERCHDTNLRATLRAYREVGAS